jgi:hypothetical protein
MQELGEAKQADAIFGQLISTGTRTLASFPEGTAKTLDDRETVATAYYLVGLGKVGLHRGAEAQEAFRATLSICPDYFGALLAIGRVISGPEVAETRTDQTKAVDRASETR